MAPPTEKFARGKKKKKKKKKTPAVQIGSIQRKPQPPRPRILTRVNAASSHFSDLSDFYAFVGRASPRLFSSAAGMMPEVVLVAAGWVVVDCTWMACMYVSDPEL